MLGMFGGILIFGNRTTLERILTITLGSTAALTLALAYQGYRDRDTRQSQ